MLADTAETCQKEASFSRRVQHQRIACRPQLRQIWRKPCRAKRMARPAQRAATPRLTLRDRPRRLCCDRLPLPCKARHQRLREPRTSRHDAASVPRHRCSLTRSRIRAAKKSSCAPPPSAAAPQRPARDPSRCREARQRTLHLHNGTRYRSLATPPGRIARLQPMLRHRSGGRIDH